MSSSCRNAALACAASLVVPAAHAQVSHFQPEAAVRAEQHTNRNLSPDSANELDIAGYRLDLGLNWQYITPTTNARIYPRVRLQRYPDQRQVNRSEQFLDVRLNHRATERTAFNVVGRFDRRDTFNTELAPAEFDDFDPEAPPEGADTGLIIAANTRTHFSLRPTVRHAFTQRTGIRAHALYRGNRFDTEIERQQTEFDYFELGGDWLYQADQLNEFTAGPYVSRYETRDDFNTTDAVGLTLGWNRRWTELFRTSFAVFGEHGDITLRGPVPDSSTSTDFGAEIRGVREVETGRWRFDIARRFHPSASGDKTISNQFRVQYDHAFTERLEMTTAARAFQRKAQGRSGGNDRDYVRGELSLKWMLSPTLFVSGGYQYTWQDRERLDGSADNHTVWLQFGYQGLGPQRW